MADYRCKYCKRDFTRELAFQKHECTQMVRAKEIQTIEGRHAYELYKVWMDKQGRKAPPIETFVVSAYYSSFYQFAVWVRQTGIPQPEKYVELMADSKIAPAIWRRQEAYQIYLEWNDKKSSPIDQAAITVDTLTTLAEIIECEPREVFDHFRIGEILELIQQRRLSPWLLFCSKAFKEWVSKLDPHEKKLFMKSIGVDYWSMKMEREPETIRGLRELAESLGI